jgi:hypothetical protein
MIELRAAWMRGRPRPQARRRPRPQARRRRALPGAATLQGQVFEEAPAHHRPFQASGRSNSPFSPRGSRGQGDEGQKARECRTPRIAPENAPLEKALPPRGCAGVPARRRAGVPARRRAGGARSQALPPYRGRFLGRPCAPSSVSGIRTLKLPLLPSWEQGAGG